MKRNGPHEAKDVAIRVTRRVYVKEEKKGEKIIISTSCWKITIEEKSLKREEVEQKEERAV